MSLVRLRIIGVTDEQWEAIKEAALREDISLREWIRQTIAARLAS